MLKYVNHNDCWFYAGPYIPSGVVYDCGICVNENDELLSRSPSYSIWLVPGYEQAADSFGVIDLYNPPEWYKG